MPRLTDRDRVRSILETDRRWSVYALGDLSPGFLEHCEWYEAANDEIGLVLIIRAFSSPVFFALGDPETVALILQELPDEAEMYLMIRPEIIPLIKARYRIEQEMAMWRMILEPSSYRPAPEEGVSRLCPDDLQFLKRLYADGEPNGEAPDFFYPSMLERGVFFGIREGKELVTAAGTHLVVPSESVAAVGNVYTRRDRRGRGLAVRVTSAVAGELLRLKLRTVALNVRQANPAARRAYERVGFSCFCEFYEGLAVRCPREIKEKVEGC